MPIAEYQSGGKYDGCKMRKEKSNQEVISMAQLCDKIRESKDMYEDSQYWCNILLMKGESANPLATNHREPYVETAIENVRIGLKNTLLPTPIAIVRFEFIPKSKLGNQPHFDIAWEVCVDVNEVIRANK